MRKFLLVIPAVLVLGALMGCSSGAKFTGSLGNNGNGPTLPPGQPAVTSLSPSTVVAGGPAFTLTLTGVNFSPGLSVYGFGPGLVTTYVSPTEMQVQIPAADIAVPGTDTVVVTQDTLNFGATLTVTVPPLTGNNAFTVSKVDIQANDMVWDPISQQIYLSVPSSNGANGDTITALDPSTGQLGISQNAGSEPDRLALASDGSYLYAGIDGSASVQRFTLPNLGMDINIPLGSDIVNIGTGGTVNYGPYYAMDVEAAPGSPHTVAIVRGVWGMSPRELGGITIYDDAVARPTSVPGFGSQGNSSTIDSIQWDSSATQIYGEDNETTSFDFYVLSVNSSGVQVTKDYPGVLGGSYANLHYDATTGYVYGDYGEVVNPSTGTVVGSFPTNTVQGGFVDYSVMVPDGTLNIAYLLGETEWQQQTTPGSTGYVLEAFDLTNFTFIGAIPIPPIPNVVGVPVKLIRWGTNGLALLMGSPYGAGSPNTGVGPEVYLISGAFVTNPAIRKQGMPPMTPGMQAWAMPTRSSSIDALGSDQ